MVDKMTKIRAYADADRVAVVALWREAFPGDPPRNEPNAILDRKIPLGDGLVFVAEHGGSVVAAVVAGYDGYRGWIYHLAVAAGWRREGIGTALMREAEAALAARGCPKVNLQVRTSNPEAVAFYEAIGYSTDATVSMGRVLPKA